MRRVVLLRLCVVLTTVLAASYGATADESSDVLIGPYVTSVSAHSARIVWVSPPDTEAGDVVVDDGRTMRRFGATAAGITGRAERLHTAHVDHLTPNTAYRYTVHCSGATADGQFRTVPEDGATPFRFAVYGDCRSDADKHRLVAEAIAQENPLFVLCTGDLVADGRDWPQWKEMFFDPARPYLTRCAIRPVRGNHEADAVLYRALFDVPGAETYYSLDAGNLHVTVIDSQVGDGFDEMLAWLRDDLARTDAEWKLVSYHIPTFNVGGHGSDWERDTLAPLFEEAGVDLVVVGHSHLYERFVPIGSPGSKPVTYIVTGGGGAPLSRAGPSPIIAGGIGASVLHHCLVEIDGERLTFTAKTPDGAMIDRFELIHGTAGNESATMQPAVDIKTADRVVHAFTRTEVDFPQLPKAGETVEVLVNPSHLPLSGKLRVSAVAESSWQVQARDVSLDGNAIVVHITAPPNVTMSVDGFDPPLELGLQLSFGRITTEAVPVRPGLSHETLMRIVPEPKAEPVAYADAAITVDGRLDDWRGIDPMPLPFMGRKRGSLRLAWREDGLYGAADVTNEALLVHASEPWTGDCIELFIEMDFARRPGYHTNVAQYIFTPTTDGEGGTGLVTAFGRHRRNAARIGVRCAWTPTEHGYLLEFVLPAEALRPATLTPGQKIGLNFTVCDDGQPIEQFYSDKSERDGYRKPITWGAIELAR
ncbi:MAG: metallophosphoesterase [Phycisphaerales bacterium]|nr:metallophosphoesterase [Phycisphaerales bacterium]